jgi:predicted nucleic acid-binding protein
MIVVSDTSPRTVLLTIDEAGLLSRLFGEVIIPEEVRNELGAAIRLFRRGLESSQ